MSAHDPTAGKDATGKPSRTPLVSRQSTGFCAATSVTVVQTSAGMESSSSQAGTASKSSTRDSESASQPSAARTSRVVPPQLRAP